MNNEHQSSNYHIVWQAAEFEAHPQNPRVILAGAALGIILMLFALLTRNFLFAIFIFIAALTLYLINKKESELLKFQIGPSGIGVGENFYPYDDFKSFWIFYDPPRIKKISVISKKTFSQPLKLPLGNQNPVKVRELLLKFLPEIRQEESLSDIIAQYLGY